MLEKIISMQQVAKSQKEETSAGGGQWTTDGIANRTEPSGEVRITGTTIGKRAFSHCTSSMKVYAPNVTQILDGAFESVTFEEAYFPELTAVYGNAFIYANMPDLYLPKLANINCFRLVKVKKVEAPIATEIGSQAFAENASIEVVIAPSVTKIAGYAFMGVKKSFTLVLANPTMVTLGGTFANLTPSTPATVYVPGALIPEYQAATNWASMYTAGTCDFVAIEGSEYA